LAHGHNTFQSLWLLAFLLMTFALDSTQTYRINLCTQAKQGLHVGKLLKNYGKWGRFLMNIVLLGI